MNIGLFGGSFNPIHEGHISLANAIINKYPLDEIWFMPNNIPPHKVIHQTKNIDRIAMIKLAIKKNPKFKLCTLELDQDTVSFTINSLLTLTSNYPKNKFFFILGEDSWNSLPSWQRWEELFNLCNFILMKRDITNKNKLMDDILERSIYQNDTKLPMDNGNVLLLNDAPLIPYSSTQIRTKYATEKKIVKKSVPKKVRKYIKKHDLY